MPVRSEAGADKQPNKKCLGYTMSAAATFHK